MKKDGMQFRHLRITETDSQLPHNKTHSFGRKRVRTIAMFFVFHSSVLPSFSVSILVMYLCYFFPSGIFSFDSSSNVFLHSNAPFDVHFAVLGILYIIVSQYVKMHYKRIF